MKLYLRHEGDSAMAFLRVQNNFVSFFSQEKLYSAVSVFLMFVVPLVTMVTAYLLIFCTIAQKSRELQKGQKN